MVRVDEIGLISETRKAHGVHEQITESVRTVIAEIRSVTRSEYYNAQNAGYQPLLVFKLRVEEDYQDEPFLYHRGKKYHVIRTYLTEDGGIEITAERSDENGTDETEPDGSADSND